MRNGKQELGRPGNLLELHRVQRSLSSSCRPQMCNERNPPLFSSSQTVLQLHRAPKSSSGSWGVQVCSERKAIKEKLPFLSSSHTSHGKQHRSGPRARGGWQGPGGQGSRGLAQCGRETALQTTPENAQCASLQRTHVVM